MNIFSEKNNKTNNFKWGKMSFFTNCLKLDWILIISIIFRLFFIKIYFLLFYIFCCCMKYWCRANIQKIRQNIKISTHFFILFQVTRIWDFVNFSDFEVDFGRLAGALKKKKKYIYLQDPIRARVGILSPLVFFSPHKNSNIPKSVPSYPQWRYICWFLLNI